MLSKIDVSDIVKNHLQTLVSFGSGKTSLSDYLLFFVVPALASGALGWEDVRLPKSAVGILITALSVFAALLFNLLLLLYGLGERQADVAALADDHPRRLREQVIRELHANISFTILVALITVAALVVAAVVGGRMNLVLSSFIVYMLMLFFLTILMVLKRSQGLLDKELGARVPKR